MTTQNTTGIIKVAVIGGGPAGLGAAIELNKLPFVDWNVYEQATAIREIGAGISIQPSTWRLLEVMGAAKNFHSKNIYRPRDNHAVQHRNGRTGELLYSHGQEGTPLDQLHARTQRSTLQQALLKEVDQSRVRVAHRLVKVERQLSGKLKLIFENGYSDEVDLVVGADGIRSVVRDYAFPEHRISYTGKTAYRVIVPEEAIAHLNIPDAITFWHGPDSWLYTCALGGGKYEITSMARELDKDADKVSWGQHAAIEDHTRHFKEFLPLVKDVVAFSNEIKQYAMFAGPRLDRIIAQDSVVLVGDASHPLSGAFGAGAGFALEDVYTLGQALKWAHENNLGIAAALELVDKVRSPHYKKLYDILNEFGNTDSYIRSQNPPLSFDDAVAIIAKEIWSIRHHWIYDYDIQQVWKDAVEAEKSRNTVAGRPLLKGTQSRNNISIAAEAQSKL